LAVCGGAGERFSPHETKQTTKRIKQMKPTKLDIERERLLLPECANPIEHLSSE
jgi:hypothetical protein